MTPQTLEAGGLQLSLSGIPGTGTIDDRIDLHTREEISVIVGVAYPMTGRCGRFTENGRLVYFIRHTVDEYNQLTETMVQPAHQAAFEDEREWAQDVLIRSRRMISRPTFEQIAETLCELLIHPEEWRISTWQNHPKPQRVVVSRETSYISRENRIFLSLCWDLSNCGEVSNPWKMHCPKHWCNTERRHQEEGEEILSVHLRPLIERLRGKVVVEQKTKDWVRDADARLAVRKALLANTPMHSIPPVCGPDLSAMGMVAYMDEWPVNPIADEDKK